MTTIAVSLLISSGLTALLALRATYVVEDLRLRLAVLTAQVDTLRNLAYAEDLVRAEEGRR